MFVVSERQARLWCLILGASVAVILAGIFLGFSNLLLAASGATMGLLLGALAAAYARGWEPARLIALAFVLLAVVIDLEVRYLLLGVFTAATFGLLLSGPWWVLGGALVAGASIVLKGALTPGGLALLDITDIPVLVLLVGIMTVTRLVLEGERRKSDELARRAEQARRQSEAQAAELAEQAGELAQQNEQQRRLLDLVATLETPAVAVGDGVLLTPLIGHLDSGRAAALTGRLLSLVAEQRARLVLLDLSGLPAIDSAVAQSLLRTIQAIQLLGCEVGVSGVTAPVASTMAQLGLGFAGVSTWRSPHEALQALVEVAGA